MNTKNYFVHESSYADDQPVYGSSTGDIDIDLFNNIIEKKYKKALGELNIDKELALVNLNLACGGVLTLAGLLLLSKNRQHFRPLFSVQCVSVDGSDLSFIDNENTFDGTMSDVFEQTFAFIGRNMKKVPAGPGFNSQTKWEIPHEVFEELLVNALVHRDYFITATTKVFVYADRVEIVNPGRLPNSITVENIKNGISIPRNPTLVSLAQYTLPYKGLGTGIIRAFSLYPHIIIKNQVEENQFKVIIKMPDGARVQGKVDSDGNKVHGE
ncbi:hypothetical protein FACS189468_8620 [Spirochaetia bacterium]|nr:hypothetical protein FACS189468_8620 [Spirochaetia bacterium]